MHLNHIIFHSALYLYHYFSAFVLYLTLIRLLFAVPKMGLSAQYVYVFVSYNVANAVIATLYQMAIISLLTYLARYILLPGGFV